MKVKFFNAKNGDAIHLVTENGNNILLDMGYLETYSNHIKKHIAEIANDNQKVDLLIISHIDQDHIGGALSFLQDVNNNEFDKTLINEIWHNSYRHLNLPKVKNISPEDYSVLKELKGKFEAENRKEFISIGDKEISAKQGSSLAGLIYKLGIPWNEIFEGKSVLDNSRVDFDDFIITTLAPNLSILEKLKSFWRNELLRSKFDFQFGEDVLFDDAYEFYLLNEATFENCFNENISDDRAEKFQELLELGVNIEVAGDRSITNASSIALIFESDGKRVLLTADASDDDLYNSLTSLSAKGVCMEFDLIKLSHHGALKNNIKWLSLVKAKYYVISTDSSKHNHPDIGSIVNLINSNKNYKIICFNNNIKTIDQISNPALMEAYNYSIMSPNKDWGVEIEFNE